MESSEETEGHKVPLQWAFFPSSSKNCFIRFMRGKKQSPFRERGIDRWTIAFNSFVFPAYTETFPIIAVFENGFVQAGFPKEEIFVCNSLTTQISPFVRDDI